MSVALVLLLFGLVAFLAIAGTNLTTHIKENIGFDMVKMVLSAEQAFLQAVSAGMFVHIKVPNANEKLLRRPISIMTAAIIIASDLELYSYWGFRLDSTPFFYLASPANAMASIPTLMYFIMPLMMVTLWFIFNHVMKTRFNIKFKAFNFVHHLVDTLILLLVCGVLFLAIRGGFKVSTMNVGKVYHSEKMQLNHAAINPVFSLLSSFSKNADFSTQYRYMDNEEADLQYNNLLKSNNDSISEISVLNNQRPNIVFIVLESFSGAITEALGGEPGVAPNLNRLYNEGVSFTNLYANSFRTDRGLVSLLSGYPAQPTMSIMKFPSKTQNLPSISRELKNNGYDLEFLYGGDVNFTNMKSYFVSSGFDKIVADTDFPVSERLTKWGVRDNRTFEYLTESINRQEKFPFMKMFLTLSSHEPFDVPTNKYDVPYFNSVAYTDSCIGFFIDSLKASPLWDNTLVILIPDHCLHYPPNIGIHDPYRYHIPMVWTGGAAKDSIVIDNFGSQIDLAATLLSQMGLNHDQFTFSKDMINGDNNKFAFYTYNNGFGILNDSTRVIYNCDADEVIIKEGVDWKTLETQGKAYLQKLYDDISEK